MRDTCSHVNLTGQVLLNPTDVGKNDFSSDVSNTVQRRKNGILGYERTSCPLPLTQESGDRVSLPLVMGRAVRMSRVSPGQRGPHTKQPQRPPCAEHSWLRKGRTMGFAGVLP